MSDLVTPEQFARHLKSNGIDIPFEPVVETGPDALLAQRTSAHGFTIGNRWCILPLEGRDSDLGGSPTDASVRRWAALGRSGAKLIWGESAAVRADGRSSPHQLLVDASTSGGLRQLRDTAVNAHRTAFGEADDLKVGIQLTHSGRLSHPGPSGAAAPVAVRRHPHLDVELGPAPEEPLLSDDQLHELIDDYVAAVGIVSGAGFDFVDLKACHGYLSHELLGAYERPGEFGGSFENRTRFLRTIVERVRADSPDVKLALRLSAFDTVVYIAGPDGIGRPITSEPYRFWFGTDDSGHDIDLTEPVRLLTALRNMGVDLICVTGSSPYNSWHLQRPALHPRPGEYLTPEDPLVGVNRHIAVTSRLRDAVPGITTVCSGLSYLQQWLPNVAQAAARANMTDLVGIARMHLAYPEFIADSLNGRGLDRDAMKDVF